jgi:hypothetical protein
VKSGQQAAGQGRAVLCTTPAGLPRGLPWGGRGRAARPNITEAAGRAEPSDGPDPPNSVTT